MNSSNNSKVWYKKREMPGFLGMKILLIIKKIMPTFMFKGLIYIVSLVYYALSKDARYYSQEYLNIIANFYARHNLKPPQKLSSRQHFYLFALSMVDKICVWNNDLKLNNEVVFGNAFSANVANENTKGYMIIGSHLGNMEVCRAVSSDINLVVNAIVHSKNSQSFKHIQEAVSKNSALNLFEASNIDVSTAMIFDEKIQKGELISIAGDRAPIHENNRVVEVNFLDKKVNFPQGPMLLAFVLKCPVYLIFPVYDGNKIKIFFERFNIDYSVLKKHRDDYIKILVQEYATILEDYTLKYPLNFFNFYKYFD